MQIQRYRLKEPYLDIKQVYQIDIDKLFKQNQVKFGCVCSCVFGFGIKRDDRYMHQFDVRCDSFLNVAPEELKQPNHQNSIFLSYQMNGTKRIQHIKVVFVPSNLGNGFNRYFVCPITKRKCKKIYLNEKRLIWFSRFGFIELGQRLYYPSQTESKFFRIYHQASNNTDKEFSPKYMKWTYKGKPTKKADRTLRRAKRTIKQQKLVQVRSWEFEMRIIETLGSRSNWSLEEKITYDFLAKKVNEFYQNVF